MRSVLALLLSLPVAASAATLTVGPTGDYGSVQAAVDVASDGDLIQIEATALVGSAVIARSLTIAGAGEDRTTLTSTSTILDVRPGAVVTVRDLALEADGGRGITATDAELTLARVRLSGGRDEVGGGGIRATGGRLTLTDATLDDNTSPVGFGGHVFADGVEVTIESTDITRGRAERGGGLMLLGGRATIRDSRFGDNAVRADDNRGVGGAIAAESAGLDILRTRFEHNLAREGQGGHVSVTGGPGVSIVDSELQGVVDQPDATQFFGGGVSVYDAPVVVQRVSFGDLEVQHTGEDGTYGYAGALFIYGITDQPFLIEDATFTNNQATGFGGAVRIESGSGTVRRATFEGNEGDYGGGLHLATDREVIVEDSTFRNNRARYAGAIRWIAPQPTETTYAGRLVLRRNTYEDNVADNYGGVMYARNGADLVIDGDRASRNRGNLGGAHMLYSVQKIEVRRGLYCQNRVEGGTNPDGGAISSYLSGADGYVISNNVFAENRAIAWGGGVSMLRDGEAMVVNNTFLANRGADGGGIAFRGTGSAPMAVTFANNLIGYTAAGDGLSARDVDPLTLAYGALVSNLLAHTSDGVEPPDATHLVDTDPGLIAYNPDGDCTNDVPYPRPDSPLVDAGSPGIFDPDGSRSDIGASGGPEADATLWADQDTDGDIALWDCDDEDPDIGPSQAEVPYDGIDQDCDGADLRDADGDGYEGDGGPDCDDDDLSVHPGGEEIANDGIDQDCDGADLRDGDGDGYDGGVDGLDCDDTRADVHPGAYDGPGDGLDADCDGIDGVAQGVGGCGCTATGGPVVWVLLLPVALVLRRRGTGKA